MTELSTINSQLHVTPKPGEGGSTARTLRVALIGCGKVADQHVQAIRRIADCQIVALCDRELLMARQLGERFGVPDCFAEVDKMLRVVKPDVVHITTPPRSHYAIGQQCLAAGSHVYVEKPFGMTAGEAISLTEQARERSLGITAGHNYQFTLEMLELRRLVQEGFVGGKPVHLESHWSYDLGGSTYATAFLGDPNHWLRQLPGQLFHNIISHGIAKLAEFLDDELVEIFATAHQGRDLARLGPGEVLDELRVVIKDKHNTTAFFVFTTDVKGLNLLRVHGPAGSLSADIIAGTIVRTRIRPCKSYLTYVIPPLRQAREYLRNTAANVTNFLRRRLYQDFGMKELIERFYDSIRHGSPPPIPYREIILTARIMDEIFAQIYGVQRSEVRNQRSESRPQSSVISPLKAL